VARVGDELWIAEYDLDLLLVTDLDGEELARVDLSAHADADGIPETDRVVVADGRPLVAVQRLDRDDRYAAAGDGRVLELDPDTHPILRHWDAGPDPKIVADPTDPAGLLVLTGVFHEPDGALHRFADGLGAPIVSEATLGYDLAGVAGVGEQLVVLGLGFGDADPAHVDCVDLVSGRVIAGLETFAFPVDLVAGEDAVYVAVRTGWADEAADTVLRVDPATCAVDELARGFTLDPFGLALVP
jgi:hypothetical protein